MERMALLCPLLPTDEFPVSHSETYLLAQRVNNRDSTSDARMSVFDRLAPLIPQVSASSRQTKEHPSVCLSPPLSLSSPVIKKKAIKISSFDEKGLVYGEHDTKHTNTDRSFVPICSSKTSGQPSWSKSCQHLQMNRGEKASTLPKAKPKTYSSPTLPARPSISIFPAPKPNTSPTLKPQPRDSLHLSDPFSLLHQPKPSVSPTLTVPTPRLTPSPTSLDGHGGKQPSPVAKERRARSITISNAKTEREYKKDRGQSSSDVAKHEILDQEVLLDFTNPALRRPCPMSRHESQRHAAMSQNSCLLQGKTVMGHPQSYQNIPLGNTANSTQTGLASVQRGCLTCRPSSPTQSTREQTRQQQQLPLH
ncbi:uncharacterized protein LOC121941998 [Plectropomus leopardus]|uniref:uncharacterized protein LOC121941998 n=1 Tax=Plectropomus leopardus TaxID=160734 RepID=UPI001C4ADAFA|nr:uncharacterized protein LOC121941998 [Plectropomus leopardus]